LSQNVSKRKHVSTCSGLFQLVKYNIEKAKNISPSPKEIMGFISVFLGGGAIFFAEPVAKNISPSPCLAIYVLGRHRPTVALSFMNL